MNGVFTRFTKYCDVLQNIVHGESEKLCKV